MALDQVLITVGIPLGTLLLSVLAWYGTSRAREQTNRLETIKVSADAYDRAQVIYNKAIEQLNKHNEYLERQLTRCETRISQLEAALRAANISIPVELYRRRPDPPEPAVTP